MFKMWLIRRHIKEKQITLRYNGEIGVRVNGLVLNEGFGQRLGEELKKDKLFNEDHIKSHETAKQELENLKDIIKKLAFDLVGKCKELDIDYKDLIAQSK